MVSININYGSWSAVFRSLKAIANLLCLVMYKSLPDVCVAGRGRHGSFQLVWSSGPSCFSASFYPIERTHTPRDTGAYLTAYVHALCCPILYIPSTLTVHLSTLFSIILPHLSESVIMNNCLRYFFNRLILFYYSFYAVY